MTSTETTRPVAQSRTAITIDEMAARTGLSRSFLYLELAAGRLKTLKIGKRRLVRVEDEAAYLASHEALAA